MSKEANSTFRALKLALEALESYTPGDYSRGHVIHPSCDEDAVIKAITALREALAEQPAKIDWEAVAADQAMTIAMLKAEQPAQQEPVAWATRVGEYAHIHWGAKRPEYPMVYEVPLYTSPPAQRTWVGLTDEEIDKIPCELYAPDQGGMTMEEGLQVYARAIEAKLKEKNNGEQTSLSALRPR